MDNTIYKRIQLMHSPGEPSRTPAEPFALSHNCQCCELQPNVNSVFTDDLEQEKLNEAIMMLNKNLQEINIQNMDTELVAQMFKNYQSNVLFHLEGEMIMHSSQSCS